MSAEEKRATAYHEGGHALLATVLPHGDPLHKVTILPRGMALGVTWTPARRSATRTPRSTSRTRICKAMGGRVAEKIVFGHLNSGAANDLEQATGIARRMVREWGMSDRVGPMAWSSQQQVFLGEDLMSRGREYSDDTAKLLDEEIARILTEQEERATDMLTQHRRGLELIAEALLEQETIDGRRGRPADPAGHDRVGPAGQRHHRPLTGPRVQGRVRPRSGSGDVPGCRLRPRPPTDRWPTSARRNRRG